jgi:hypothetical protein
MQQIGERHGGVANIDAAVDATVQRGADGIDARVWGEAAQFGFGHGYLVVFPRRLRSAIVSAAVFGSLPTLLRLTTGAMGGCFGSWPSGLLTAGGCTARLGTTDG